MELRIARSAGFCMGVRRAIEIALDVAGQEKGPVYTYGPLIHNPQALEDLRRQRVFALAEGEPVPRAPVIIRAHGISPELARRVGEECERLVDATCPNVATIQKRIEDFSSRGFAVVIAGDAEHPEVVGLLGHASGPAYVVSTPEDVEDLPELGRVVLLAQTTQDQETFDAVRERLAERYPDLEALSTICRSTHRRQSEVRELARDVDALVVVGGRDSANTRRLAEISRSLGTPTYHVETAAELDLPALKALARVGVTAGASTPGWILDEVVRALSDGHA